MFDPRDYYGNKYKWFIGKVKDVNDPLNSNRVRVNIFGIHPDEELIASDTGTVDGGQTASLSTIPPATLGAIPPAVGAELAPVDRNNLANPSQLTAKISNHFTLAQLALAGSTSGPINKANLHLLSQDVIYNLTNLAVNCLDPIKEAFGNVNITSGWRAPVTKSGSFENHPKGYAADIQIGGEPYQLANWIASNLKGRFNLLILEHSGSSKWVHVQLGSSGLRNQGSTAQPLIQTYVNGRYTSGLTYIV